MIMWGQQIKSLEMLPRLDNLNNLNPYVFSVKFNLAFVEDHDRKKS